MVDALEGPKSRRLLKVSRGDKVKAGRAQSWEWREKTAFGIFWI